MTPYDAWRTNVEDTRQEEWEEALEEVACRAGKDDTVEMVSALVNADDGLRWICGVVTIPDVHIHSFRDLVKLAGYFRGQVEQEMKTNRKYPDAD